MYHGQASSTLNWVQRIRAALDEDRLRLYSQPIVDLRSGEISHHELLLRMLSPEGELILPAAFVPVAERFGLIGEIDRWVVAEALRHALAGMQVAVNLSAYSLSDATIVAQVREAVEHGLEPSNLSFEITETTLIRNTEEARLLAGTLAGIGCGLALDDFGTGFGSFVYLKHLPARYLKIDMEFVRNASHDGTDQEIIRSITGIAHALGKQTIAEGVEDQGTLRTIREQGVDLAQGFYIGRPEPLSEPVMADERAA